MDFPWISDGFRWFSAPPQGLCSTAGRVELQASAAWSSGATDPVVAWLLALGVPVAPLLPEAPEALAARLRGLRVLKAFGHELHVAEAVAGCLRDPEAAGRRAACEALLAMGGRAAQAPRAVPRLLRLVQKDVELRELAARALGALGATGLEAMEQLGGLDGDPEVQGLTALAIGSSGVAGDHLADRLMVLLETPGDDDAAIRVRLRAASASPPQFSSKGVR